MSKESCSQCKQEFQEGELVALSQLNKDKYHVFDTIRDSHPMDCMTRYMFKTGNMVAANRAIFYQEKFHDIDELEIVARDNQGQINLQYNESKTGDVIQGNLSGLIRKYKTF